MATDTAGQTENGSLQRREYRPLHATSTLVILFQHVPEAVPFEVDLVKEPAVTAVIVKNFSLTTEVLFLLVVYMIHTEDLKIIAT